MPSNRHTVLVTRNCKVIFIVPIGILIYAPIVVIAMDNAIIAIAYRYSLRFACFSRAAVSSDEATSASASDITSAALVSVLSILSLKVSTSVILSLCKISFSSISFHFINFKLFIELSKLSNPASVRALYGNLSARKRTSFSVLVYYQSAVAIYIFDYPRLLLVVYGVTYSVACNE